MTSVPEITTTAIVRLQQKNENPGTRLQNYSGNNISLQFIYLSTAKSAKDIEG